MALTTTISEVGQSKLAGKISVFVEDDPIGSPSVFKPIGACVSSAQSPAKDRDSIVQDTCINTVCGVVWQEAVLYIASAEVNNAGGRYSTALGGTSGTIPPTHKTGTATDGGVTDWLYLGESADANTADEGVPSTSPGSQSESTFTFSSNHVPGSDQTRWLECTQESGAKYRWMLCHINNVQQILRCAWIKSYTPDSIDDDTNTQTGVSVLSLCDGWHYVGGESLPLLCDGVTTPAGIIPPP